MLTTAYRLVNSQADLILIVTPSDYNYLLKHRRPGCVIPLNFFHSNLPMPLKGVFVSCQLLSHTAFKRNGYIFQGYYMDLTENYIAAELRLTQRAPFAATLKRLNTARISLMNQKFVDIMADILSLGFPHES